MTQFAARAEGVCKTYGTGDARVTALDDVTARIPRGRFTAVTGPSGSGKSTLMHVMAGLDSADAGRVHIGGRRLDPAWLDEVIGAVGLGDRLAHRPSELSGGQQQRVACARALAGRPEIIFADEPTGNLDSRSGADILAFLRRCVDEMGQTIVMVTHDPAAAARADEVITLTDGRIVDRRNQTPPPSQVLAPPPHR